MSSLYRYAWQIGLHKKKHIPELAADAAAEESPPEAAAAAAAAPPSW